MRDFLILILLSLFTYQAQAQVVAKVGSSEITLQEFKNRYKEVKASTVNPPAPELFLEDLVRYELGLLEAGRQKISDDPEFKDRVEKELYKFLLEKEIGKKVEGNKVTEAEMKEYYKNNPELRSSHILIETKPGATPEQKEIAKKRADEIYQEVKKSNRPFAELAKIYSDDSLSKGVGGDIGYQNRITVAPTYYDTLIKLKADEIGGPVETLYGFHIMKLTGRRSFQDADRRQLRVLVFDEKRKDVFNNYFKELRSRYKVTKFENLVKSIK
jgi:parvulin-like peptidyl-prolyl isomerase